MAASTVHTVSIAAANDVQMFRITHKDNPTHLAFVQVEPQADGVNSVSAEVSVVQHQRNVFAARYVQTVQRTHGGYQANALVDFTPLHGYVYDNGTASTYPYTLKITLIWE